MNPSSLEFRPGVLALSGLDPTGGAGIQADIEAIAAQGCHCFPIVTCLTVQDTRNVYEVKPVDERFMRRQLNVISNDCSIQAIKIGLLGSAEIANAIADWLETRNNTPVVLDPVLRAGGGENLASQALIKTMRNRLLSRVTLLTPNCNEATQLANCEQEKAPFKLLEMGCQAVFLTTTDDSRGDNILHFLYQNQLPTLELKAPRLSGQFHGSGCTLAATCAARLALGDNLAHAAEKAQNFTMESLRQAEKLGSGQFIPKRIV